jgi:RHS repeat-associated core domain
MENNQKVNPMRNNCFVILFLVFMNFNASLHAQTPRDVWVLDSMETGTKKYIARESVSLLAGFKYTASAGSTFSATVDPTLLFPPTNNGYLSPDDTITSDPALGGVVGAIPGNFNVSQTGAAIYSVPIEVLPGIQGLQPNLTLIYNSQSGNGMAGMCWNLGGLSMISRVPENYYHDNNRSGIIWDNTSPLALDGQRLILVGTYGSDSVEYRTESGIERIVGYTIKSWGPLTFKVYTKDGKVLEYGSPSMVNSYFPVRLNHSNIGSASEVYHLGWALTRVIDANNNYVDYIYSSDVTQLSGYYHYKNVCVMSINYGNHTGGIKETVGKIDFQYIQRTNPYVTYIDGMEMSNAYLLDKIEVRGVNNMLVDVYELNYTTSDDNYFLAKIKKMNAAGEIILPLEFNWGNMYYPIAHSGYLIFGPTPTISTPQNATSFEPAHYGDIDGDGFTDVLVHAKANGQYYWILYRNNGDNTYQCLHQNIWDHEYEQTFLFLDMDGSGEKLYVGRYRQEGSLWGYYLDCYKYQDYRLVADATGNIRLSASSGYDNDTRKSLRVLSADFKGKGTPQLILFRQDHILISEYGLDVNILPLGSASRLFLTDINGNGKTEIAYRNGNVISFKEFDGTIFGNIHTTELISKNDEVYTGDFNGDGNTDLFVKKSSSPNKWTTFISTGSSFIEKDVCSNIPLQNGQEIMILDANRDGKSDVFIKTTAASSYDGINYSTAMHLYISNGNEFITKELTTNSLYKAGKCHIVSNFRSGSNKDVFISYDAGGGKSGPHIISLCDRIRFNKISSIKDSFGQQLFITYNDYKNPNPSLAFQNLIDFENDGITTIHQPIPQLEIVSKVTAPNIYQLYEYANPEMHRQAKGFLGFSYIKTTDNIRSLESEAKYIFNSTYYFLYPYRNTVRRIWEAVINETTSVYTVDGAGAGRYSLRQDSLISTDALKGITVKTSYSNYDAERNPRAIKTDYGNGISSTEDFTYVSAGSRFLNKIASRQIVQQAPGEANVVRKEYFSYDGKGNPSYHVIDSTDVNKVQTAYSNYDKYGNAGKITTTANGVSRSQTFMYTSFGRLVGTIRNDQLNETVTYDYDPLRLLMTSETGRIGTTSYEYDNFGRLKQTIYPDGVRTVNTLQWAGTLPEKPANAKFYSYTETGGQSPVWVWYDSLSREIRRDAYGLNGNKVLVETEYNGRGEVYRVSEPYFENTNKTYAATYAYDQFGRNSMVVTPMGTTTYTYSGLTTSVATPTGTSKITLNPVGWVVEEETNGKKVSFTHYASGQVKTSTPQDGQAITIEYDLQGNRKKLTDPDAGVVTSQYDGWGQLVSHTENVHLTGNSIVTTFNYHPSGLLNNRLRNGETTSYGYDSYNRLQTVSTAGRHIQNFTYDQYDRIIKTTSNVDGSKEFASQTEYDRFGRVSKETYPGGYFITNQYDKYGYLTGIVDMNNSDIWNALESNAKGQLKSTSQGGRITYYNYDARGFTTAISNPNIIDMRYSYTAKGNLDNRQDYKFSYKETFGYDAMNRLTDWKIYLGNTLKSTNSLTYHPTTGLISSKSDLGSSSIMNYGEDGQPPHALTSITGPPSLIPSAEQSIIYTDFKKTSQITEGDNVLNITYGVGDQRIKSVLTNPSGTLTRYYAGNYEEENRNGQTRKIHYINGGNGLAALYVRNNGKDTLFYVHTDYQGSILALSLPDGTVKERYAYDPWGKRRDPLNWTQPDSRKSFIFHRGYTMHEHLPEFNLINMNGRMYDPLIAQFLGLDPYVQSPGNWLNYNRYSYAFNNPLIYSDPSGEYALIDDLIAAAIGGIVNVVVQAFQGNIHSWGQGFSYFGVGAAGTWAGLYTMGAASGAIIGAGNSLVTQGFGTTGKWDGSNISGQQIFFDGIIGGATSAIGSSLSGWISPYVSNLTSGIGGQAVQQGLSQTITGSATGFTINAGGAWLQGASFEEGLKAGGQGALMGAGIGATTGMVSGMRSAYKAGENPWTGKSFVKSPEIQYGNNPNQEYHTFRHTDELGLSQFEVRNAVELNLKSQSHFIENGKPFNQTVIVNGQRIQYTAYKLPNGIINIGRIHGVK